MPLLTPDFSNSLIPQRGPSPEIIPAAAIQIEESIDEQAFQAALKLAGFPVPEIEPLPSSSIGIKKTHISNFLASEKDSRDVIVREILENNGLGVEACLEEIGLIIRNERTPASVRLSAVDKILKLHGIGNGPAAPEGSKSVQFVFYKPEIRPEQIFKTIEVESGQ